MPGSMMGLMRQMMFVPSPSFTGRELGDQTGRVHIITGGYTGVGLELAKLLYGANATIYLFGRSEDKGQSGIAALKQAHPNSKGTVSFIRCDMSDLKTIKPAVDQFLAAETQLHVLTNNAGVMMPPSGSKDAQGFELQIGVHCLAPYLLTKLLHPILAATAKQASVSPGTVRVTWASSSVMETLAPKPGGMVLDARGAPALLGSAPRDYGQSKTGTLYLAVEASRRDKDAGIIHLAFNPGNLRSGLQRYLNPVAAAAVRSMCYDPVYGAYTELWAAASPDVTMDQSGSYVVPWGRVSGYRSDVEQAVAEADGRTAKFWSWCDSVTAEYS